MESTTHATHPAHPGCAVAPLCLTSNKDAAAFNQIIHEFTAAYAVRILGHVKSRKTQAGENAGEK